MNAAATLRDLLQQAVDKRQADGLTAGPRELERVVEAEEAARPRGMTLNRTTASQILRGTYKGSSSASDGTIRAVGWLAGVSDEVAFAAAGRRIPGPPFAMELPPGVDDLSPGERRAAIELLRALVAQRQEINQYVDALTRAGWTSETLKDRGPDLILHGPAGESVVIELKNAAHATADDAQEQLLAAARTAQAGYQKGRAEQGDAGGEGSQDQGGDE